MHVPRCHVNVAAWRPKWPSGNSKVKALELRSAHLRSSQPVKENVKVVVVIIGCIQAIVHARCLKERAGIVTRVSTVNKN
jgi:hypothetical protein